MTRLRKPLRILAAAAAALAALAGLYAAAGVWLAPRLAHDALVGYTRDRLGHVLELRAVRIDPWRLTLALEGARLSTREGAELGAFERLAIDLDAASLRQWAWQLREVTLQAPRVAFSRRADTHNWAALLARLPRDDSAPPRVRIARAAVTGGMLRYEDQRGADPWHLQAQDFALTLEGFSLDAGGQASWMLRASLDDGAGFTGRGQLDWPARSASGSLSLTDVPAALLLRLAASPAAATGGKASASAHFALRGDASSLLVEELEATVAGLALAMPRGTASVATLALKGGRYAGADGSLQAQTLRLGDAALAGAGDNAPRAALGTLELDALAVSPQERNVAIGRLSLSGLKGADRIDGAGQSALAGLLARPAGEPAQAAAPWRATLKQFVTADADWRFERAAGTGTGGGSLQARVARMSADDLQLAAGARIALARVDLEQADVHLTQRGAAGASTDLQARVARAGAGAIQLDAGAPGGGAQAGRVDVEGAEWRIVQRDAAAGETVLRARLPRVGADALQYTSGAAADAGKANWRVAVAGLDLHNPDVRHSSATKKGAPADVLDAAFARLTGGTLTAAAGGYAAATLQASGGTLQYAPGDAPARAVSVREVALSASRVRYPDGEPFPLRASVVLPPKGRVHAEGTLDPRTLRASLAVKLDALPLAAAQPWIEPHLALRLKAGALSADGRLRVDAKASPIAAQFEGQAEILGLAADESASGQPLIGAQAVRASGMKLDNAPLSIVIDDLELDAPTGRIEIAADRSVNVGNLRPSATNAKPAATPLPLAVKRIRVHNGRLDFADRSIQPAFAVRIDELAGTVSGLDAGQATAAKVALEGRVDQYGEAKIRGALDPFSPTSRTDLTLAFRNLEMRALDPYARRFAGYRIETGKLSGDLRYRVRDGKLEGDNQFVIEKLKLGERIVDTTSDVPVELAIALLTDSEGRIELAVPVKGDLDRPEFDLGQVMAQAISGAIGKIVTAPFRLLAGLFGGGEETIDRIWFDPGAAKLSPPEREKIVALARALQARPQLALRVEAAFDAGADAEALRADKLPVNPEALVSLARARGESIRAALLAQGADAKRVSVAEPQSARADPKHGIAAGLTLGAR